MTMQYRSLLGKWRSAISGARNKISHFCSFAYDLRSDWHERRENKMERKRDTYIEREERERERGERERERG